LDHGGVGPNDLRLKAEGDEWTVRLADAQTIAIVPYDSGARPA